MELRSPNARIALVHLIDLLADPDRHRREWVLGRPGWEEWADEFYDDLNDGLSALESADGSIDPHAAIGDTLRSAQEADVLAPLLRLLDPVDADRADRSLPSRRAAELAVEHPLWTQLVEAAAAARAVLHSEL